MPGMAASPTIFERIQLPEGTFEMHLLEWEIPNTGESLTAYAQRIAQKVKEDNPILVGVSFGGRKACSDDNLGATIWWRFRGGEG